MEAFGSRRFTSLPGRQICGLHFEGSMISTVDTCPDDGNLNACKTHSYGNPHLTAWADGWLHQGLVFLTMGCRHVPGDGHTANDLVSLNPIPETILFGDGVR
eukprot:symbB.v1.2.026602.t1/scaffold2672.1/size73286/8